MSSLYINGADPGKSHPNLDFTFAAFTCGPVLRDTTFQSSAYGKRENVETSIDGRVMFDMLPYMFRNHKLSSYSLNSVSAELLGQQKEDVHYSIISDLQVCSCIFYMPYEVPRALRWPLWVVYAPGRLEV